MKIAKGDQVQVRDHAGKWHDAVADSPVEGTRTIDYGRVPARSRKIHDFPVVWVRFPKRGEGNRIRIPWPAEHVRKAS
jgi:hypothetical protein